jgi:hypothetical protein
MLDPAQRNICAPVFVLRAATHEASQAQKGLSKISQPNPSVFGQPVALTAAVTSQAGAPPDGETVTFFEAKKVLGTAALSGGSASLTASALWLGTDSIHVTYGGDSTLAGSASKWLREIVNPAPTAITLTSSQNPSVGQPVTLMATVTPEFSGKPHGTVTFYDGTVILKTKALSGGAAQFTTSKLTSGGHSITVTYNPYIGTKNFTGSSTSLTQTVN